MQYQCSMPLLDELQAAADRNAAAIERLTDPATRAGKLDWTKAQLAAHLAAGSEEYLAMASRRDTVLTAVGNRAAINDFVIERENRTPLSELAERLRTVTRAFVDFIAAQGDAPVGWYEHDVAPDVVAGLYLADMLVHSHDLVGADLPVRAAAEACKAAPHVLPFVLTPGTRPRAAAISLHPHGLPPTVVSIDGNTARVHGNADHIDAKVAGDAATMLLTAYGRLTPLQSIRRGMRVTGRRPWRVRALQTRFETP